MSTQLEVAVKHQLQQGALALALLQEGMQQQVQLLQLVTTTAKAGVPSADLQACTGTPILETPCFYLHMAGHLFYCHAFCLCIATWQMWVLQQGSDEWTL
jgi:hypothetical protein